MKRQAPPFASLELRVEVVEPDHEPLIRLRCGSLRPYDREGAKEPFNVFGGRPLDFGGPME